MTENINRGPEPGSTLTARHVGRVAGARAPVGPGATPAPGGRPPPLPFLPKEALGPHCGGNRPPRFGGHSPSGEKTSEYGPHCTLLFPAASRRPCRLRTAVPRDHRGQSGRDYGGIDGRHRALHRPGLRQSRRPDPGCRGRLAALWQGRGQHLGHRGGDRPGSGFCRHRGGARVGCRRRKAVLRTQGARIEGCCWKRTEGARAQGASRKTGGPGSRSERGAGSGRHGEVRNT